MTLFTIMPILRVVLALAAVLIYSLVSAYVFKFGQSRTGIFFDYFLLTLFTVIALKSGGAI